MTLQKLIVLPFGKSLNRLLLGHLFIKIPEIVYKCPIFSFARSSNRYMKIDLPSNSYVFISTIDDSGKDGGPHFTQCMTGKCP